MISPFPVTPPQHPHRIPLSSLPFASKRVLPQTQSCLTPLTSPFPGASSLHRTKCHPFHCHQTS